MRRLTIWSLIFGGCALIILSVLMLLFSDTQVLRAQDDELEYVGSRECSSCHSDLARLHSGMPHALALQSVSRDQDLILADFESGEDVRTVQFPDEDAPRPFTADDIAYAVGSGRYAQRYLYEVGRNEYAVFPAEWNVQTGQWQPYGAAEDWPNDDDDWVQNCAGCHTTGLEVRRGRWQDDGVSCESCHGPGSEHARLADRAGRDPSDRELTRLREAIVSSPDAQICGQCHSQGVSPDGGLPYPVGYLPGMELLTDTMFTLLPPTEADHWWATGHASGKNMQFNEWITSAHASALTSLDGNEHADDGCLTCHSGDYNFNMAQIAAHEAGSRAGSAPDALTLETAAMGITCVNCHDPHSDTNTPFQLVTNAYSLCTSCHTDDDYSHIHHPVQQMFEGVSVVDIVEPIASSHFTDQNGPDCVTCHMERIPAGGATRATHALVPVLPGEAMNVTGLEPACTTCHEEQVDDVQMQQLIDDVQNDTQRRLDSARATLTDATAEWVGLALDFVEGDGSLGIHNYAYSDRLLDAVEAELGLSN